MSKKPNLPGADALFRGPKAAIDTPAESPDGTRSDTLTHVKAQTSTDAKVLADDADEGKDGEQLLKYSLYFTPSLLEKLDDVWFRLRRKRRDKISKWRIVNAILAAHLDDIDQIERLLDAKNP